MRNFIDDQLSTLAKAVEGVGGEFSDYVLQDPATLEEVEFVESSLGRPLPKEMRRFVTTVSRGLCFEWTLPEETQRPNALREIFSGGLAFELSALPEHEVGRAGWQTECFPDPEDSYDVVWHDKLAFHHVPNGDYLGLDPEGRVIYLSHDDGEGHGYVMANSFPNLLERWIPWLVPGLRTGSGCRSCRV